MTKIRSDWPTTPLETYRTQTDADLQMEHVRVAGGNAATLHGYITGVTDLGDNSPSLAPAAPGTGRQCHDHSGGEHGRPLFRSVCTMTYAAAALESANLTEQFRRPGFEPTGITDGEREVSSTSPFGLVCAYIPGCDEVHGAYLNLGVMARVRIISTTLLAADEVTLVLRNVVTGASARLDVTPDSTGVQHVSSTGSASPADTLLTKPGQVNLLQPSFELYAAGTGATRAAEMYLCEIEVGVFEV